MIFTEATPAFQFAAAAGHEVAGSMALNALGKLHDAMAHKKSGPVPAAEPKAMVYYQAAMLAYPKNFMAANDLGVATKIVAILQAGAASKSLFAAPSAAKTA